VAVWVLLFAIPAFSSDLAICLKDNVLKNKKRPLNLSFGQVKSVLQRLSDRFNSLILLLLYAGKKTPSHLTLESDLSNGFNSAANIALIFENANIFEKKCEIFSIFGKILPLKD